VTEEATTQIYLALQLEGEDADVMMMTKNLYKSGPYRTKWLVLKGKLTYNRSLKAEGLEEERRVT
jgi:hypothetical protein